MRKLIYIFIFLIAMAIVSIYFNSEKNIKINELSNLIQKDHKHQIDSAIMHFESSTDLLFNSIVNKRDVLEIQQKALNAKTTKERDKYRKELYEKLTPLYGNLKKFGIKQLHFHFPDTTSFLRFHKPSKYGDNLKEIRYSLVLANTQLKTVSGFEEGRIFNGYRFVYPLIHNKEHIGSVETSIGFNAIKNISKEIYNTYQYMVLDKDVVKNKLFSGERKNYDKSFLSDEFYHEANSFLNYKNPQHIHDETISLELFKEINTKLKDTIDPKKLKKHLPLLEYVNINGNYYFVNFLPIKNVKNENIGYVVSYGDSKEYKSFLTNFYEEVAFVALIMIILFVFLYKSDLSREKINEISRRERDSALAASKAKSEFLANMSHEIRTPLNAILGFVDILREESKGRKSLEYVEIIHNSSKSLMHIIEDILDFSKIESGKLEIEKVDFDTKSEFEVITHLFSAKSSQKNINLTLILDDNLPKVINTDPLRIKQVVANLLSNAIKFTGDGKKVVVQISFKDNYLHVNVKDEGKGIAKDKLEHIFEAFSQEDNSTTRNFGGTGLGLSISNELIKLLDGELKVKSELGVGSEFYFSVPVGIGKEIKVVEESSKNISFEGKKALLVEDNKANQMFMKVLLKSLGINFDIANDGIESIEAFSTNRYDFILMDENMPNMNGIEAVKHILNIEEKQNLKHTPIIALTANALKGDRDRFLAAGMDDYLTKPLDKKTFTEVLGKHIG